MSTPTDNHAAGEAPTLIERVRKVLGGEPRDIEELRTVVRHAQRRKLLGSDALTMIEGVFDVADMQARDIMIPRSQMVVVEDDAELDEILPAVIESGHSRFPVIDDNRDEVVGIVLAKDLLQFFPNGARERFNIRDIMRGAAFVPESKRLNTLLQEFRTSRNHMAIVVDEYGGTAGLITIEDILEQIVGDIDDEHDSDEDSAIREKAPGCYVVDALTPIEEFNEHFDTEYSDDEFDTIGGVVVNHFGHVPCVGETAAIDGLRFSVEDADSRRIRELEVIETEDAPAAADADGARR